VPFAPVKKGCPAQIAPDCPNYLCSTVENKTPNDKGIEQGGLFFSTDVQKTIPSPEQKARVCEYLEKEKER
jgi:hypothetical protein